MVQELAARSDVEFIAGGATQNSIRVAQWMLQIPHATAYMGCVGTDAYADKMTEVCTKDGVMVIAAIPAFGPIQSLYLYLILHRPGWIPLLFCRIALMCGLALTGEVHEGGFCAHWDVRCLHQGWRAIPSSESGSCRQVRGAHHALRNTPSPPTSCESTMV